MVLEPRFSIVLLAYEPGENLTVAALARETLCFTDESEGPHSIKWSDAEPNGLDRMTAWLHFLPFVVSRL